MIIFQVDEPKGWWVIRDSNGIIHFGGLSKREAERNMKRMMKSQH